MTTILLGLLAVAALLTVYALVRGIITMASGKDISGQQSNRYMSMRVTFQLLAILLVVALLFVAGRGLQGG
jgi:hypothetical protein